MISHQKRAFLQVIKTIFGFYDHFCLSFKQIEQCFMKLCLNHLRKLQLLLIKNGNEAKKETFYNIGFFQRSLLVAFKDHLTDDLSTKHQALSMNIDEECQKSFRNISSQK